jgi:tetratricopeptide (TPR) repeat protein
MIIGEAHPPSEVLAAFVDARLPRPQVVPLTEHLADCAECRFVVESAAEALDEVKVYPRKALFGWLSVAAMLGVGYLLMPMARTTWDMRELRGTSQGQVRIIEPRVTGGFAFAPRPRTMRSGATDVEGPPPEQAIFQGKAAELLEDAKNNHFASGAHARGIAHLMLKETPQAITELTSVTTAHPDDAKAWSDLAAAQILAGHYDAAHAAAERALQIDPKLNEARFNRALATFDRKREDSIPEWNDYLIHDPTGPWSKEAKERIYSAREQ